MRSKPGSPRWKPGESGNPKGRKPGTKNRSTLLRESIDIEGILGVLQKAAMGGDVAAARLLVERSLPPVRAASLPVEVPGISEDLTLTEQARVLLGAIAAGELAPDAGTMLIGALGSAAHLMEIDELTARVKSLEDSK